ncbi:hypothetical protein EI220_06625 [Streptococcus suis]|uniref:Phage Holliday junction resolvase n=2 Tax=Streptococcus suis TaxID=1307 RepID=A0A426G672_STRSU|nr:hypothetical protein [Streptococcus suis]RRN50482.1 hypothetical protein EI220_06625 [Streptococcus suis]
MKFEFILSNTKRKKEMLNANDRMNWAQKAKITAYLRHIAFLKVSEGKYTTHTKKHPCGLLVTIYAPTKRRMDPPNFYPTVKALIDGMTDAGIWTDDNHEVIKFMTFEYGGLSGLKDKYRIEIEVKEVHE